MIKRLIFDVDGTLIAGAKFFSSIDGKVVTGNAIVIVIEEVLKKLNLYSKENVEKFLNAIDEYEEKFDNYNRRDYVHFFEGVLNAKLDESFIDILFDEIQHCIPENNEKLVSTLTELSKKYELVILTNYFSKSQINRLNNMGIGKFFIECYGESLIKPHYNSYISACGKNKPSECVMIGDDFLLDVENAAKAGLNTIWVNSKNLKTHNTNTVMVKKVEEITEEMIEGLVNG